MNQRRIRSLAQSIAFDLFWAGPGGRARYLIYQIKDGSYFGGFTEKECAAKLEKLLTDRFKRWGMDPASSPRRTAPDASP